jgi:hypothetical protein
MVPRCPQVVEQQVVGVEPLNLERFERGGGRGVVRRGKNSAEPVRFGGKLGGAE